MSGLAHRRADFPPDFRFGVAASAYQIEGHGFGGAGRTHWDDFAATPGNVARAENGAVACDHYHRWEEDLDLIRAGGFDLYRFSFSWARIQPEGRGAPHREGIDFYDRLIDGMLARGIEPNATLYHWELPSPLADRGGWRNREIADRFADYASLIGETFGDRLAMIAPINEPWCVAWLSHFLGHHAPGLRDIRAAARAMHHVMLAHGRAIGALRAAGCGRLGGVFNFERALPAREDDACRRAAELYHAIYNEWFLAGAREGRYPEIALSGLEPHLPDRYWDDFAIIAAPLDWLGINYYTCKRIEPGPSGLFGDLAEVEGPSAKTTMGWEIFPEGLGFFLRWVSKRFARGLPIWITENGMSSDDRIEGGAIDDAARLAYLNAHLAEVKRAIADGVDVRGYVVWSLMDNFEWALGYEKRFGLVHVDFETLERTPKRSYRALTEALSRG